MIPPFKRVRNTKHVPTLQIMDRDINKRSNADINPLRGLEDPRGFDEFDKWFACQITMDRTIRQSHKFFKILLGHDALGWLGDEVSFFKCYFLNVSSTISILNQHISILLQHIHEYLRLISEKQRQYPNVMSQCVTHIDTFFWVISLQNL